MDRDVWTAGTIGVVTDSILPVGAIAWNDKAKMAKELGYQVIIKFPSSMGIDHSCMHKTEYLKLLEEI